MSTTIEKLIEILHTEKCSCVIYNEGTLTRCHRRGVVDLLMLLENDQTTLSGAMIADKVVGKGAAALMILGGVRSVYADVISVPALDLLSTVNIEVSFGQSVLNIINRSGTGICPVENLCKDCISANDCLPRIKEFVKTINQK